MATPNSGNVFGFGHLDSGGPQLRDQNIVVHAPEGGMRLLGRTKILFDPKMNLNRATFKPTTSAIREDLGFRYLFHPQQLCIKSPRRLLLPGRDCQLNVIDRTERSLHQRIF